MDVALARWLVSEAARSHLERAAQEADPSSLAAATRLRRDLSGDQAAAVLDQVALRRRARAKLGESAERLFFTRDGLEQATRWAVARWRADRLRRAGAVELTDAAAGLGVDARAGVEAG
ncbi:MAG: SAM-dependent methyltransferase, partial [Propionibacteriaceae bacterium]|nr:SAM-dependent methyltransferase [Propionibacteriaceae bacterium]